MAIDSRITEQDGVTKMQVLIGAGWLKKMRTVHGYGK